MSPLGKVLAGPNFDGEAILTADLDLDDVVRGKYDFDVTGHYARPDVFRLYVNEERRQTVMSDPTLAAASESTDTPESSSKE